MKKICVVGSVNLDFFTTAMKFPEKGETILGDTFFTQPGGKGANQAVAAAKLGGEVHFIGAVGKDDVSRTLIENFESVGIQIEGLEQVEAASGVAQITIAEQDNTIIVVPGANDEVSVELVKKHADILDASDIVILQMEIPLETIEYVIDYAHQQGKTIILNPAPAHSLSADAIKKSTYITPNEIEVKTVFGDKKYADILEMYPNKVVLTKGSNGAYFHNGTGIVHVPAEETLAVDTTGAGDTFNGAFAVALSEGKSLPEAVQFANQAAAVAITKMGAQAAMPTRSELKEQVELDQLK